MLHETLGFMGAFLLAWAMRNALMIWKERRNVPVKDLTIFRTFKHRRKDHDEK